MPPLDEQNVATHALLRAHREMGNGQVQPTGNADRDFVLMMLPHQRCAVAMARVQLEHGADPEVCAMAEEIIAAQEAEIAEFEAWLAAHPE